MTKILVIEDNEPLAALLAERLTRRGHEVLRAHGGAAGLADAKAANPEAILLAQQLRGQEDWATARALKSDDHTRAIPIVGLLSDGGAATRAAALAAGCDRLHVKPIEFGKLMHQLIGEPAGA